MRMIVLYIVFLIFNTTYLNSQTGYGYVRDKNPTQVNYAKIARDASNRIKNTMYEREKAARELGWSSYAEMAAARRSQMIKMRNERKMRKLQYRIDKRKRKAQIRKIKKQQRLKKPKND